MALRTGILGLPNVGKSTLFNALTQSAQAQAANYPFCTIEPNVGIVEVPDERLQKLAEVVKPDRILPATVEFVDIAGLVRGASKGEGMGNKFLAHVREADALVEVVRFFENDEIHHVEGKIDPKVDKETIETELILADLETISKKSQKAESESRGGDKKKLIIAEFFQKLKEWLEEGKMASDFEIKNEDEEEWLRDSHLLTAKKILYIANVDENKIGDFSPEKCAQVLGVSADEVVVLSAKLESDLVGLDEKDSAEMLASYGITEPGLNVLARKAYKLLGLQSFFTAGVQEVRAWTVRAGATAPQAAGVIHTDFEKGFIRSETTGFEDFVACNGWAGVKEKGKMRVEGKEYIMRDGDVCFFLFNN